MVLLCHLLCRAEMCVRVSCDLVKVQQTTQSPPSHPPQIAEHNYCWSEARPDTVQMFSVRPTPCQLVSPALLSADICWSLEMARSGISPASVRAWQGEYKSTCFKDNRLTRGQHSHQGSDQLSPLVCYLLPEVLAVQSIKYTTWASCVWW